MNSRLLFWVPAILRFLLVLCGIGIAWLFLGRAVGLAVGLIWMCGIIFVQLYYLYRLGGWLDHPDKVKLPDGWGAWTNIFSRLYKLRRDDEKNRAELVEWLARFRLAMSFLTDGVVIMDDVILL
jgi:two-component system phosphate regulon sensor histidine kinase PhoR